MQTPYQLLGGEAGVRFGGGGPVERDQWLLCMDEALRRIDASDELKAMLKEPMFVLADTVRNSDGEACSSANPVASDAGCDH